MLVICATDEEEKMLSKHFTDIIKTGVGYGNVYKALHNLDRNTPILNIGYAGSNNIPIGKICAVGKSMNYHPCVKFKEREYQLNGQYPCYTANDFVEKTEITEPCLFDMELYAILSMGFTQVMSIKIVSDNLNQKQYNTITKGDSIK